MPLEKLTIGNADFMKSFKKNKQLYSDLVENGQHPKVLWVGCSDSRVVPEFTVNANAGDLFVIRNIANIIPPQIAGDKCTSSVLEYAILHLNVEHIIICGHTGCGGINATVSGPPENTKIEEWLKYANPALEEAKKCCDCSLVLNTIKENILLQAKNLLTYNYISEKFKAEKLEIHEWLYDMNSGKISYYDKINDNWVYLNQ